MAGVVLVAVVELVLPNEIVVDAVGFDTTESVGSFAGVKTEPRYTAAEPIPFMIVGTKRTEYMASHIPITTSTTKPITARPLIAAWRAEVVCQSVFIGCLIHNTRHFSCQAGGGLT